MYSVIFKVAFARIMLLKSKDFVSNDLIIEKILMLNVQKSNPAEIIIKQMKYFISESKIINVLVVARHIQ
ncbi:MAG: hypothetical protein LHW59_10595 [Candidatus Cloacimonetes bacterium]|nr:hypothetical protein [Candidatus Cloacimonadota bacterium]